MLHIACTSDQHNTKRGSYIATTIQGWIETERDFRIEANNAEEMEQTIESYNSRHPDNTANFKVPAVIDGKTTIMIEEFVPGVEISTLFGPR